MERVDSIDWRLHALITDLRMETQKLINEIAETISPSFFPTSQFEDDFSNVRFKELKNLFDSVAEAIEPLLPINRYEVSTNLGRGGIAFVPWVGIHSTKTNFDSSANNGFYLTILWKKNGSGVCLSLQKGTDGIQGGNKVLRIKTAVDLIRSKYGTGDLETSINLEYNRGRPKAYEQAHISGREYDLDSLSNLPQDLLRIETLYDAVVNDNPMVVLDKKGSSGVILSEESFEATHDRDTLEQRTDDLLEFVGRPPAEGNNNPPQKKIESNQHERLPGVKADVLDRAKGVCEWCSKEAPFKKANGRLFLEVHHAIPLGEGGPDTVDNAFALCPNCHREAHYGANKDKIRQGLKEGKRKPKRKDGGLGQRIAELGGQKFPK
jgi:hypothetical protein